MNLRTSRYVFNEEAMKIRIPRFKFFHGNQFSVLLVEETGVPRENHRPATSH
jgi:hypothetical protein